MYNRYIPQDEQYTWVQAEEDHTPNKQTASSASGERRGFQLPSFLSGQEGLSSLFGEKGKNGLSSLLKSLHPENIDTGDILLLLIILYLLVEGDDLDLVIALGLVLIIGLGDHQEK